MQESKVQNDEQIIMLIQKGNAQEALKTLYGRKDLHTVALFAQKKWAGRIQSIEWQDIFFECLIRMTNAMHQNRFDTSKNIKNYFQGICFYYCQELLRKHKKECLYSDQWVEDTDLVVVNNEIDDVLKAALRAQSETCQVLFELSYFADPKLSQDEIAEQAGYKSRDSVKTTLTRCREQLREYLKKNQVIAELIGHYFK